MEEPLVFPVNFPVSFELSNSREVGTAVVFSGRAPLGRLDTSRGSRPAHLCTRGHPTADGFFMYRPGRQMQLPSDIRAQT